MSGVSTDLIVGVVSAIIFAILALLWKRIVGFVRWLVGDRRLAKRLRESGITNIYASRADYALYRDAPRLIDYLSLAHEDIVVAGYWLAQGAEIEGVIDGLRDLLRSRPSLRIQIVVIDPTASYVDSVAVNMDMSADAVRARAAETLRRLAELRQGLTDSERQRLRVATYLSQPVLSLIALDGDRAQGKIQVDIKPYGVPRSQSFSLESGGLETVLYQTLYQSSQRVLLDAVTVKPNDAVTAAQIADSATGPELGVQAPAPVVAPSSEERQA